MCLLTIYYRTLSLLSISFKVKHREELKSPISNLYTSYIRGIYRYIINHVLLCVQPYFPVG
jgi:hypothetical protein